MDPGSRGSVNGTNQGNFHVVQVNRNTVTLLTFWIMGVNAVFVISFFFSVVLPY